MIQMNLCRKQNEHIVKGGERDNWEIWDGHVHTAVFKMDNQWWPTVQHKELCPIPRNNLNGQEVEKQIHTRYNWTTLLYTWN